MACMRMAMVRVACRRLLTVAQRVAEDAHVAGITDTAGNALRAAGRCCDGAHAAVPRGHQNASYTSMANAVAVHDACTVHQPHRLHAVADAAAVPRNPNAAR